MEELRTVSRREFWWLSRHVLLTVGCYEKLLGSGGRKTESQASLLLTGGWRALKGLVASLRGPLLFDHQGPGLRVLVIKVLLVSLEMSYSVWIEPGTEAAHI